MKYDYNIKIFKYRLNEIQLKNNELIVKSDLLNKEIELNKKKQLIIILTLLLVFILIILISLFKSLKRKNDKRLELEKESRKLLELKNESEKNERIRISKQLHDIVGGGLSAINLMINELEKTSETVLIKKIKVEIININFMIRKLSHDLYNQYPKDALFSDKIKDLFYFYLTLKSKIIVFNFTNEVEFNSLNAKIQDNLYLIIQECIVNAFKHSQATKIELTLFYLDNQFDVFINDNGNGFDTKNNSITGIGLNIIKDRTKSINGEINIESNSKVGTSIYINFKKHEY